MSSGIKITDDIKEVHRRISLLPKKEGKLYFACIKFGDKKDSLKIQFTSDDVPANEQGERVYPSYDQLISGLPADDVKYLLYDIDVVSLEGTHKGQVVLLSWHPQCSSVKARLVCGSTFSALRSALSVSKFYLEADCNGEACSSAVVEKFGFKCTECKSEAPSEVVTDLFKMDTTKTQIDV